MTATFNFVASDSTHFVGYGGAVGIYGVPEPTMTIEGADTQMRLNALASVSSRTFGLRINIDYFYGAWSVGFPIIDVVDSNGDTAYQLYHNGSGNLQWKQNRSGTLFSIGAAFTATDDSIYAIYVHTVGSDTLLTIYKNDTVVATQTVDSSLLSFANLSYINFYCHGSGAAESTYKIKSVLGANEDATGYKLYHSAPGYVELSGYSGSFQYSTSPDYNEQFVDDLPVASNPGAIASVEYRAPVVTDDFSAVGLLITTTARDYPNSRVAGCKITLTGTKLHTSESTFNEDIPTTFFSAVITDDPVLLSRLNDNFYTMQITLT